MPTSWTRRDVVQMTGGGVVALACGGLDLRIDPGASFDQVLDALHTTDPEFGGGLANHGPMCAETLATLGREDRVAAWTQHYGGNLVLLASSALLLESERALALGDVTKSAAWIAAYATELETASPAEIIARDFAWLAPGWMALHGALRTAHALRSFERADTPSRRREVAHGLGYWAASQLTLPGVPGSATEAGLDVAQALAQVRVLPETERISAALIKDRLRALSNSEQFAEDVVRVDLDALPLEQAITELAAAAARLFIADGSDSIDYLHAITGTSALRLLQGVLTAEEQRLGLGYAFQAVAALHAANGSSVGVPEPSGDPGITPEELGSRAGESDEEHVIKLSEVALREWEIDPRPEFLLAAKGWLDGSS